MEKWDWELIGQFFKDEGWAVGDSGALLDPILGFSISRNDDLQLLLETSSEAQPTNQVAVDHGTIFVPDGSVTFTHLAGSSAIASGIVQRNVHSKWDGSGRTVTVETSSIHSLAWTSREPSDTEYVIEWLDNMAHSFHWPHGTDDTTTTTKRREFRGQYSSIAATSGHESKGMGRHCANILVHGTEIFIGSSVKAKDAGVIHPGFILYVGNPEESTRSKIRDCLRFCLGLNLIYLGHTAFNSDWAPVSFTALSPNVRPSDVKNVVTLPPSPLGRLHEWQIEPPILEAMASALYTCYDNFALQEIFWSYWHATAAPVHMAAAHFGALIELARKGYVKHVGDKFKSVIIDKVTWKAISARLVECINESRAPGDDKTIIINKISSQLNGAPQSVLLDRFLASLDVNVGKVEKSALAKRNAAAHGDSITPEEVIETIRLNRALLVLVNRIVLAMTTSQSLYYDYYTIGRPIVPLKQAIGGHEPAKK